jgi:hypothetical protein
MAMYDIGESEIGSADARNIFFSSAPRHLSEGASEYLAALCFKNCNNTLKCDRAFASFSIRACPWFVRSVNRPEAIKTLGEALHVINGSEDERYPGAWATRKHPGTCEAVSAAIS